LSEEEEKKLSRLEKRLVANVDFDDQALNYLGFGSDIYYMLGLLGCVKFSNGVSRVVHNPMLCHLSMGSLLRQVITEGHKSKHGGVVHRYPHQIMWCPT
jgi:hypothetical protein